MVGVWSVLGGGGKVLFSSGGGRHLDHRLGTRCPLELGSAQPVQP